jgi:hypothetical protein
VRQRDEPASAAVRLRLFDSNVPHDNRSTQLPIAERVALQFQVNLLAAMMDWICEV